ncbi:MAG: selenocysteine-specific translation elongation factor [Thermodesulfovibrionales bacterium]|nr:selenocysteine-specific translation elongation factor [Thermodesulfovibrionales bacterium]
MHYVILGTAGHIDHGKSTLVKALTGIDPDRLKEEKERGITIDLGFADLVYPDGLTVGIVDVPGHERLVRNMLAGAGGIDIVLFVIAADEGIMPQSREHLAICNLLKIKSGLIVITKTDLVEEDWVKLVSDEVRGFVKDTFLENAEIIPVSSKTGENIDLLKEKIKEVALKIQPKLTKGLFRLPVDRVFTLKGFGTVVTGTAISGSVSVDDAVDILPSNISSKVRGLHSHGKAIKTAYAGQRVAINLTGVEKDSLKRGDVVVMPGRFSPTKTTDAKIELLKDAPVLKNKSLVHFHSGTAEVVARIILYDRDELKQGEDCFCQLRLQGPVISMSGDRYIIRRFSPVETIGGGEILDAYPSRRKKSEGLGDLEVFEKGALDEKIAMKIKKAGVHGIPVSLIEGWINADIPAIKDAIRSLKEKTTVVQFEDILIHGSAVNSIKEGINKILIPFHKQNPLKTGMPKEEVRVQLKAEQKIFNSLISSMKDVVIDKDLLRSASFKATLSEVDKGIETKVITMLEQAGFQPPLKDELLTALKMQPKQLDDILKLMTKEGKLVRINETIYITKIVYDKMLAMLKDFYNKKKEMTVAEFRDVLGTSRKYALPFLEYLDTQRITMRVGDVRKFLVKG